MLEFVTTGDALIGKSSLVTRLTDQHLSTNPNATVGALDVLSYWEWEDDDARFRCGIWKQIDIHSGRRKTRLSNYNVRIQSPPRLLISSRGPVAVSFRISNLTVLVAL